MLNLFIPHYIEYSFLEIEILKLMHRHQCVSNRWVFLDVLKANYIFKDMFEYYYVIVNKWLPASPAHSLSHTHVHKLWGRDLGFILWLETTFLVSVTCALNLEITVLNLNIIWASECEQLLSIIVTMENKMSTTFKSLCGNHDNFQFHPYKNRTQVLQD